jgi:dihydrofolate reductase
LRLSLIAAVAANGVIGRGKDLPWHLRDDLKRFKRLTVGHTILMGRRTYESIGRPLPKRRSLVLSRNPEFLADGVEVARDLGTALRACAGDEEVFVIGGRGVYEVAMQRADRLCLTDVEAEVEGDVYFPEVDWSVWDLVWEEAHPANERHELAFTFRNYERRS